MLPLHFTDIPLDLMSKKLFTNFFLEFLVQRRLSYFTALPWYVHCVPQARDDAPSEKSTPLDDLTEKDRSDGSLKRQWSSVGGAIGHTAPWGAQRIVAVVAKRQPGMFPFWSHSGTLGTCWLERHSHWWSCRSNSVIRSNYLQKQMAWRWFP